MDRLKGKTILIGKEPENGRLLIFIPGGKGASIGAPGSVPQCVSRCKPKEGVAHAKITVDQNGNMTLTNMKSQNVTYVNGSEIASKHITTSSNVELGKDRFKLNLPIVIECAKKLVGVVTPPQPQTPFNISHLKRVWEEYEAEMDRIAQMQIDNGRKRMLPIMIGSLSGAASIILPTFVAVDAIYVTAPITVICAVLYLVNYRKKDTSYQDRKAANEKLMETYVCPNPACNRFLGNISYKLLKRQYNMHCPHARCNCEYVER